MEDNNTTNVCEFCGREISKTTGECRWSDCPDNQTTCGVCEYEYSVFSQEGICPRCYGRG